MERSERDMVHRGTAYLDARLTRGSFDSLRFATVAQDDRFSWTVIFAQTNSNRSEDRSLFPIPYSLLFPFFATGATGKYPVRVRTVSLLFPLVPAVTSTRRKPGSVVGLVEW